jgi:hypothetical protein
MKRTSGELKMTALEMAQIMVKTLDSKKASDISLLK